MVPNKRAVSGKQRFRTALALWLSLSATAALAATDDPLASGFQNPPNSARPRVWWHWMNGNITKDGIRKDLEWMKRVGIGGVQNFDANLLTPQIVDKRLVYMTPEWKDAFRYAATLADQMGLELAIASSPGWSETGGPWVQPKDGLKKLVWSETQLEGGKRFQGPLPAPPSVTGPFQTVRLTDPLIPSDAKSPPLPTYYADVAVLAYPMKAAHMASPRVLLADGKEVDGSALTDDSLETAIQIPSGTPAEPATLILTYNKSVTIRSATVFVPGAKGIFGSANGDCRLDSSDNGTNWRPVAPIPLDQVPTTVSFAPVTARQFRLVIVPNGAPPFNLGAGVPGVAPPFPVTAAMDLSKPKPVKIAELRLSPEPEIDRFETKAGFSVAQDYYALTNNTNAGETGVAPDKVIDLTNRMKPDGTLDWTPPPGNWRVLRLGYSLLGTTNHPATAEATGLEVDKFDGPAVHNYIETYLDMYRDAVGADLIGKHGVRALLTDSIEVGAANWTPRMIDQFKKLRGYDPTPWLPALTGVIIGSRTQSDAFLYDYRRTLADLISSEHYGTLARVAHEHGLTMYGEALEDNRPSLGDDMTMRSHTDVPMAAMWTYARETGPKPTYLADDKGASSVAHVYGQNIAAAESMTSSRAPWAYAPDDLRRVIDLEFALGINRPVVHTSVHQPLDDKIPGLSLFIFGQYFTRHETYAEMAKPWVDYMARNSFMLQQGRNFADVAYFFGEEAPLTGLYGQSRITDAPTRYAYDFVNPDALINQLSVEDGALVAKSGARYRVLYLGGSSHHMTLPTLQRLDSLVEAGATVIGEAPIGSPSLPDQKPEYAALIKKLWSGQPITTAGKGRVIAGHDVESALASMGVTPDFSYTKPQPDSQVLFVHRRVDDGDIYFVNNRQDRPEHIEARFRVTAKAPEIWHADTGISEQVSYRTEGDQTVVPLEFDAEDSFFVVFRKPATAPMATIIKPTFSRTTTLEGPWNVAFQPGRGAPASIKLAALGSLSEQSEPGVKYFSGVATYTKDFTLPQGVHPGAPLMLDLGRVAEMAEVRVNGQFVGTAWHAPFKLDIGKAVKAGQNQLDIRVADLWVNRLIGDAQPGAKKITYTSIPTYNADAPLRASGLIGPVRIMNVNTPAQP